MRSMAWLGFMGSVLLVNTGCGENCQSTCRHVYDDSECNVSKGGIQTGELLDTCVSECEAAMKVPGEMGDYDPFVRVSAADTIRLENESQAAAWIDCVWEIAPEPGFTPECSGLDPQTGYCAPI